MPLPSKDGQKSRVPSPKDFFPPPSSWGQRWESENTRAAWSPVFSLGGGPPRRFWPTLDLAEQYINLTVSSKTDFRICWCSTAKSTLTNKSYISSVCVCVCDKSLQSCPTLCNPVTSPPGSSVRGILQARILEWVAMPFFKGSSWHRDWTRHLLCLLLWQADSLPLAPPGKLNEFI